MGRFWTQLAIAVSLQLASCGSRSQGRDDAKILRAARLGWEARVAAKQHEIAADDQGTRTSTGEALLDAAIGDLVRVRLFLPDVADGKTLNEALFVAARSEPLVRGVKGAQARIDAEYVEIAKLLLDKGADFEARDEHRDTPLIWAAGKGETGVVKLLLDRGAAVDETDTGGSTALMAASCMCPTIDMPDTEDAVLLLLQRGANVEARDKSGSTPLMTAADWGRSWILRILLDHGAQMEDKDDHGNTALLHTTNGGALPMADAVRLLLERGADIEAANDEGNTPLTLAASTGGFENVAIVKMLLDSHANPQTRNAHGKTAMNLVSKENREAIVSLLRKAGAR